MDQGNRTVVYAARMMRNRDLLAEAERHHRSQQILDAGHVGTAAVAVALEAVGAALESVRVRFRHRRQAVPATRNTRVTDPAPNVV